MSEDLQSMVQLFELYGKGLNAFGKAIMMSGKGAKKGIEFAEIKNMQRKMKIHYASTGSRNTMTVKDLEKLTGGQYSMINLPFEDSKNLLTVYDALKKIDVAFAELPDLNLGDGYTQIAINPQDAQKVKVVLDNMNIEQIPITLEDYERTGKEVLQELANRGYEKEAHMDMMNTLKERNKDPNYTPISINLESLLMREEKDGYYCRIPGRFNNNICTAIYIPKTDVVILDKGQTIITHIKAKEDIPVFQFNYSSKTFINESGTQSAADIVRSFDDVDKKRLNEIDTLKVSDVHKLPNFNEGMDAVRPSLSEAEKAVSKAISYEKFKERSQDQHCLSLQFPVQDVKFSSDKTCLVPLPQNEELQSHYENYNDYVSYAAIEENNYMVSEDQQYIDIFLDEKEKTHVLSVNGKTKKVSEDNIVNQSIYSCLAKDKTAKAPTVVKTQLESVSKDIVATVEHMKKS